MKRKVIIGIFIFVIWLIGERANVDGSVVVAYSDTISLRLQNTPAEKIEEYTDYNCEDEMAVLDSYAVKIQSRPKSKAYIIVYGGQYRRRGEVAARMSRITYYLRTNRMISAKRIRIVNGGYRQSLMVELWLIMPGEAIPRPTPSLRLREVRFKRGRIEKWEYTCGRLG